MQEIGTPDRQAGHWYSRPVLFVSDVERSRRFYVDRLGFTEAWRHAENGKELVAEVSRAGCVLLLSSQWPDKVGSALTFVSLDPLDLAALQDEYQRRKVDLREGWWGYRLMIVEDPDGNLLYFPWPQNQESTEDRAFQ